MKSVIKNRKGNKMYRKIALWKFPNKLPECVSRLNALGLMKGSERKGVFKYFRFAPVWILH